MRADRLLCWKVRTDCEWPLPRCPISLEFAAHRVLRIGRKQRSATSCVSPPVIRAVLPHLGYYEIEKRRWYKGILSGDKPGSLKLEHLMFRIEQRKKRSVVCRREP